MTHTTSRTRHARIILPVLAIGLALTGATAYAAEGTTTPQVLKRFNIELSDEQKQAFEQIRQLKMEGKTSEAIALAVSAGLPEKPFKLRMGGDGEHRGMHGKMRGEHEAIKTAIENNDYAAFKTASADAPFADKVDEAFFAKMVEAHNLREAGDHEGAHAIMEELGFPKRAEGHGPFGGTFFLHADNLTDAQKARLAEAKTLFESGDHEGGKAILKEVHDQMQAATSN